MTVVAVIVHVHDGSAFPFAAKTGLIALPSEPCQHDSVDRFCCRRFIHSDSTLLVTSPILPTFAYFWALRTQTRCQVLIYWSALSFPQPTSLACPTISQFGTGHRWSCRRTSCKLTRPILTLLLKSMLQLVPTADCVWDLF